MCYVPFCHPLSCEGFRIAQLFRRPCDEERPAFAKKLIRSHPPSCFERWSVDNGTRNKSPFHRKISIVDINCRMHVVVGVRT
jgi:hypothetical protein